LNKTACFFIQYKGYFEQEQNIFHTESAYFIENRDFTAYFIRKIMQYHFIKDKFTAYYFSIYMQ